MDRPRGWTTYSAITAAVVAASALAAGIVFRLTQKGILSAGPAGLLELIAFIAGFLWITVLALRLIHTTRTVPGRI